MKLLHLLFAAALTAAAVPSHADASPWGIAAHPHSEMEWKNIDKELSMMRDAGMTSLRHDMKFSQVARKKGEYDFSRYDELLAKLDEYGIEFLPILEGYDWEIEKSRPDAVPLYKHPDEWRKFVRACAQHYKGKLKTWEIWNEQDGGFWKPNPNASQYVPLLKIAYEELKAADPENIVMEENPKADRHKARLLAEVRSGAIEAFPDSEPAATKEDKEPLDELFRLINLSEKRKLSNKETLHLLRVLKLKYPSPCVTRSVIAEMIFEYSEGEQRNFNWRLSGREWQSLLKNKTFSKDDSLFMYNYLGHHCTDENWKELDDYYKTHPLDP